MEHVALEVGCRACVLCRRGASLVVARAFFAGVVFAVLTAACARGRPVFDLVNVSTPLADDDATGVLGAARVASCGWSHGPSGARAPTGVY
jgi:hypothetical protein